MLKIVPKIIGFAKATLWIKNFCNKLRVGSKKSRISKKISQKHDKHFWYFFNGLLKFNKK